jgi:hypothetical protein
MKIYEILALSRSGHHSVVNWIIRNTIGFQCDWTYKLTELGTTGLFYLNEANHDIPLSFQFVDEKKEKIKKLYLNYEDTPGDYTIFNDNNTFRGPMSMSINGIDNTDFTGRVIVIRDFYNLLASRLKANENKIFKKWNDNVHLLEVGEHYIFRWKSQAKACLYNNTSYLRFEDWLNNKEVREDFLYKNFGLIDNFGTKGIFGTRSSFGSHDGVQDRSKQMEIPDEIKELIRKDTELHYLMGSLGYDYKEI